MNSGNYINHIIYFFVFTLSQVFIFDNFVLYDTAFCFFYIGFLLFLPFDTNKLLYLSIGFITGIFIDIFNDTIGVHAAACVALTYIRSFWLNVNTPRGGFENLEIPNIKTLGFQWFLGFAFPLIFAHHAILFFTEAGNFYYFFYKLLRIFTSSILTFTILVIYQYLFIRRVRLI